MWCRVNGIFQGGVPGAARLQQMTSLGAEYRRTTLFHTAVMNWLAPRVVFYKKEEAVCPTPKARVRSLAGKGGQMEELKTCLQEYRLPQRGINGRNRVPKAAFDQTGWHSLGDICQISVESVCIYPRCTQWRHLNGSSRYCCSSARTHVYFMDKMRHSDICLCMCVCFGWMLGLKVRVHGGGFVATNSLIASRESRLPFESLWTHFALNILLGENLVILAFGTPKFHKLSI